MAMRHCVATVLLAGSIAAGADRPVLSEAGRSPQWLETTAACRRGLAELDVGSALVRGNLSRVRRCVDMLARTDGFNWKRRTAVTYLERMLADLAEGRHPHARYAGKGLAFPYWSESLGRIEAIWLHAPARHAPDASRQLFMYYKCGGGIHLKDGKVRGGYRPTAEVANRTEGTFHAWSSLSTQVKGRNGAERELVEASGALAEEFPIDANRVFLTGWSDGGFTSVWLASRWPHLVAGVAPACANWQYTNVGQAGLWNVPMLCVDGWGDGGYNSSQFRRWHALRTAGADAAGIWGHHGHRYTPYEDVSELRKILAWARERRRDRWPRRVRYDTWNLTWHRAYWVSIERMDKPWLSAQIDANVAAGNRIDVRTWNVAAYRLTLSDRLVDPGKTVTVTSNGKESYEGPFRETLDIELSPRPEGKFVKDASMPGGIVAQLDRSRYMGRPDGGMRLVNRKWLWVRPTGGTEADREHLANWVPRWAKDDTAVTEADLAEANLFLYGGPDVNRLTARMAPDLPVTFGKGSFRVGRRVYNQPTNAVKFIHPNPLNPKRYVIVHAFNDAATFAQTGYVGTRTRGVWEFRSGDCAVMGIRRPRHAWAVAAAKRVFASDHYVFANDWRPAEGEPVARPAEPLSYAALLEIRAAAAREATGADVGVIFEYSPSWSRWRDRVEAGPAGEHDLATIDAIPEYVATASVSGETLRGLLAKAATSTVTDPEAIDPDRTYRIASGSRGIPAYGAEPAKMPPLHFFRTPEEFVAGGNTSLPVRDLRTTPIDMSAALISYARKHGRLAAKDRPPDLLRYIIDPRAGRMPGTDWLHIDTNTLQPGTLSVGLAGTGRQTFVDLETLRKAPQQISPALPVKVEFAAEPFVIRKGGATPQFGVGGADADSRLAACMLVELRLAGAARPVEGMVVLSPGAMRRREGDTWPDRNLGKPTTTWYAGFSREPRAVLGRHAVSIGVLLLDGPGERLNRIAAPGAGFNFGLVGIRRKLEIPADGSRTVRMILASVDAGRKDAVKAALDALRGKLPSLTGPDRAE